MEVKIGVINGYYNSTKHDSFSQFQIYQKSYLSSNFHIYHKIMEKEKKQFEMNSKIQFYVN